MRHEKATLKKVSNNYSREFSLPNDTEQQPENWEKDLLPVTQAYTYSKSDW